MLSPGGAARKTLSHTRKNRQNQPNKSAKQAPAQPQSVRPPASPVLNLHLHMSLLFESLRVHFPVKLYQMIESESADIIKWENDGRSFRIVDPKRLVAEVLPRYLPCECTYPLPPSFLPPTLTCLSMSFSAACQLMSSLQRQLNLYGFRCVNRGEDKGHYSHPQFARGQCTAVRGIRRQQKSSGEVSVAPVTRQKALYSAFTCDRAQVVPEARKRVRVEAAPLSEPLHSQLPMPSPPSDVTSCASNSPASSSDEEESIFLSICETLADLDQPLCAASFAQPQTHSLSELDDVLSMFEQKEADWFGILDRELNWD